MFHDVIRQFDCKKDIRYVYTPRRESVCGGGGGTLTIIHRCVPDAFYRVRTLDGISDYPPCMGSGAKPVAKNRFRAFQRAKTSPQDTQLNTISYIFLPKSN